MAWFLSKIIYFFHFSFNTKPEQRDYYDMILVSACIFERENIII